MRLKILLIVSLTGGSQPDVPQDKFIKLMKTRLRWNSLPLLALRHLDSLSGSILPQATRLPSTQFFHAACQSILAFENLQPRDWQGVTHVIRHRFCTIQKYNYE